MSDLDARFSTLTMIGEDAEKFLQGQVTADVTNIAINTTTPTAICDLKGRVAFGLWLKRVNHQSFELTIADDLLNTFKAHLKKYSAFSKLTISDAVSVYPALTNNQTVFSSTETMTYHDWLLFSINHGHAFITAATAGLFQPQELRLHQREGVSYNKGCYLGQEIVARLWFKAKPKAWLHLISDDGEAPASGTDIGFQIQVVNSIQLDSNWHALVIAKPDLLVEADVAVLALPDDLNGEIGRV